jgi:hypothetical protein
LVEADAARDESAVDWNAVRLDYESREGTLDQVAARHGITRSQLSWKARSEIWRMRNTAAGSSGGALLKRLYRLLERQIHDLEKMRGPMSEKEAATLGRVAATLEKLMEIDRRKDVKTEPRRESKDLKYLRDKVKRRLAELGR